MKKKIKQLACAFLGAILISNICVMPSVKADMGGYTTDANGVMTITGTTVTVRLANKTIYIEGVGEIPDYTPATYTQRPWHYLDYDYVVIGDGISRVGTYAFADQTIKRITINVATFVADGTSFANVAAEPELRIKGITSSTKQIGNIAYDSLDSIIANAPTGNKCSFIMDDTNAIWKFWEKTYPYLPYVYSAKDSDTPWEDREDMTDDITFNAVCKLKYSVPGATTNMHGRLTPQGEIYTQVIAAYLQDYTYDCAYNMSLDSYKGTIYGTNGEQEYVLTLRNKDQVPARHYCLIQIRPDGQVAYLQDLDADCTTVTFSTDYPTGTYALVYKY